MVRDESGKSEELWPDPLELLALDPAARWVTTDYNLGDCVLFPMMTFHGSLGNAVPGQLRLNADVRMIASSSVRALVISLTKNCRHS